MCRLVDCETCGKKTWAGWGLHIDQALQGVDTNVRCRGWKTGKCPGKEGPLSCKSIEERLRKGFQNIEFLSVEDLSDGCGDKFKIIIVTDEFDGVKLIDRHQQIRV